MIIDLGETAINHPFFSMTAVLNTTTARYKIATDSENYKELQHVCFADWIDSDTELQAILQLVNKLLPICLVFADMRLVNAINASALDTSLRIKNRINKNLISFLKAIN